jgi:D-3-phosphoglycerate dehydrogenase
MKILANDGISQEGAEALRQKGFTVVTENVPQEQLIAAINQENYVALLVRSATTARKELIDACPNLKLIGRGGVGMDNIDVAYARSKGLHVINTPSASSQSVAEMVMGNLFALSRDLYDAYREMPINGFSEFKSLKKKYGKGQELRGKTIGIIGFGRIGQALASYALGVGMKVIAIDNNSKNVMINLSIQGIEDIKIPITSITDINSVIHDLDYISLHVPKQANGDAVIDDALIAKMKTGVIIVNAARGGVINEKALLKGIEAGKIRAAGLDVFENEPTPDNDLLTHKKIASTPHIGAATNEAQSRIGIELAQQIYELLK